jgi:hypothetical protein
MKQSTIQTFQTFVKPPLPKGYSPSHILTYRKCEYKFLLAFVYKAKVETKYKPLLCFFKRWIDISSAVDL